jgi:hypothetical protein
MMAESYKSIKVCHLSDCAYTIAFILACFQALFKRLRKNAIAQAAKKIRANALF